MYPRTEKKFSAGSVFTEDMPPFSVAVGNPCSSCEES